MREFKIYAEKDNNEPLNFWKFKKEVENRINENQAIIERSKECNEKFAEEVMNILSDESNLQYAGAMIADLQKKAHRYSFIKNIEYDGKNYEAEIDELERRFYLHEV